MAEEVHVFEKGDTNVSQVKKRGDLGGDSVVHGGGAGAVRRDQHVRFKCH